MKNNNKAKMITLLLGAGLLFGACGTTQAATNIPMPLPVQLFHPRKLHLHPAPLPLQVAKRMQKPLP